MQDTFYALTLLKPYDIDIPKIRIGPPEDGGYILADMFTPDEQPVLSYGISTEYSFDRAMAERGHQVFMFDHTIPGIKDPHPNMRFFREGVAGGFDGSMPNGVHTATDHENSLFSIEDHIERHAIKGNRLILKMDVESYEFGALYGLSDEGLSKFEQIVLEMHSLESLSGSDLYRSVFIRVLEKINRHFTLFHIHANNVDGHDKFHYVDGMPVTCLIELSYVRTDRVNRSASRTVYPTTIDYPNLPKRDKLMWVYPFLPDSPAEGAYEASLRHVIATDPTLLAAAATSETAE